MKTVDVIIPTYKPGIKLKKIIERLCKQSYKVNKIILINTEKKYFEEAFGSGNYFSKYENVDIYHIEKKDFDHARTRMLGVSYSDADMFIMMTDDAIPKNTKLVEELVTPLVKEEAAVVYGRQCVSANANEIERYTRMFNYPLVSSIKTIDDRERLGIKTYFCSDVCAAYNRTIFDKLGQFVDKAIFNEDMLYAAKAINNGYAIYYNSKARVEHFHKYTCMQQLRRNFDLGVSQAMHPEVFEAVPSTKEGIKLVKCTCRHLIKKNKWYMIPELIITSGFKYIGFFLGKRYNKLPDTVVRKITMNQTFWSEGR